MSEDRVKIEAGWRKALFEEFEKPYMKNLRSFIQKELQAKKIIYPRASEYFAAFNMTPLSQTRVVILGQDPYHGPNQAHGLCFSVRPGVKPPPSLENIFKELESDLGLKRPKHGCLVEWAKEGVLLLNATLSVKAGQAGSHQGKGWEEFSDAVIDYLNKKRENIVFILWGSYAQKKGALIDNQKHFVIKSPHPSPLSSHRGFFGSKPFSKTNTYLKSKGLNPINWELSLDPPMELLKEN